MTLEDIRNKIAEISAKLDAFIASHPAVDLTPVANDLAALEAKLD